MPSINTNENLASLQEFLGGFRLNRRSSHILGFNQFGNELMNIRYDFATGVILDTTTFYFVLFCLYVELFTRYNKLKRNVYPSLPKTKTMSKNIQLIIIFLLHQNTRTIFHIMQLI